MSGNAVYFGRNLRRIPISSYANTSFVSPGIGGIVKPYHFYVPAHTSIAPVNAKVNVVDQTNFAPDPSEFLKKENDVEKSKLRTPDKVVPSSEFAPLKIEAKDLYQLKKSKRVRKDKIDGSKKSAAEEPKAKRKALPPKHRFSLI